MAKILKDDEYLLTLLKEVVRKCAGKTSEPIVEVLFKKTNVSEFKIASDLKLTINQTRNILYKLSNFNILASSRKKDEKKGWYTYFWTLNMERCLDKLLKMKYQELSTFENLFKSRSMKNFYCCANDNIEMSEETAMGYNFICQECGELLQLLPEEKKVKDITNRIEEIKKQINLINIEFEKIKPKVKIEEKKIKKIKGKIKENKKNKINISKKLIKNSGKKTKIAKNKLLTKKIIQKSNKLKKQTKNLHKTNFKKYKNLKFSKKKK